MALFFILLVVFLLPSRSGGLRPPQQAMRLRIDSVLLGAAEAGDLRYGAFRIA